MSDIIKKYTELTYGEMFTVYSDNHKKQLSILSVRNSVFLTLKEVAYILPLCFKGLRIRLQHPIKHTASPKSTSVLIVLRKVSLRSLENLKKLLKTDTI
jgi:predicted membrane-bound mannosyltransferase